MDLLTLGEWYSTPLRVVEYHSPGVNKSQYLMKGHAIPVYYLTQRPEKAKWCRRLDENGKRPNQRVEKRADEMNKAK